ncbi:hypothetical protein ACPEIF_11580 [Streptomyces sp. NPDC012600]|uniref:hypothetical protein n=1 Tax=unclassified Streptomyces TaxID=2593676 RepID=UPI0036AA93FB
MDSTWFVVDDPEEDGEEPWGFDADELAFISALQDRAASWRVQSADSVVGRPEDESFLLVYISLSDDEHRLVLGEWAVHFHGTHVVAGKVRDQLFNLHRSGPEFFRASGTVDELADRCGEWFAAILNRPVSRAEWHRTGPRYPVAWHFADSLKPLVGNGEPREPHSRCVLIRGATEPQEGLHSPLCPGEPVRSGFLSRWRAGRGDRP